MKKLSVIVPTYNECENVRILAQRLHQVLAEIDYEIVFVDDHSEDGTWEEIEKICREDSAIRGIRRFGRKDLSSAVTEAGISCSAELIAVIDGDLQHDEQLLLKMLGEIEKGMDVVVGSRYLPGAGTGDWPRGRMFMSRIATWLLSPLNQHNLSDPLSGFFLIRKQIFSDCTQHLSAKGFKILLNILLQYERGAIAVKELPYNFRARQYGLSKFSLATIVQFGSILLKRREVSGGSGKSVNKNS